MKLEIKYQWGMLNQYIPSAFLRHRTCMDFFGASPEELEEGFPRVIDLPDEEVQRLLKACEEYQWAQKRLKELSIGPPPKECQCGNCPE